MKTRKTFLAVFAFIPFLLAGCNVEPVGNSTSGNASTSSNPYADRAVDVKLVANSDLVADSSLTVLYGEKINSLSAATRNYSTFRGWYTKKTDIEYLVHDGSKFTSGYDVVSTEKYNIQQNESNELFVEVYAKYNTETITVNLIADSDISEDSSVQVEYYSDLPELAVVEKSHNVHVGWHTMYNEGKVVVTNKNGFVSNMRKLSLDNYEINLNKEVNLYADFELEKIDVTCILPDSTSNTIKVPYGDRLERYASTLRYNGYAISKWSTVADDTLFEHVYSSGITNPITLYASEYNKHYVEFVAEDDVKYYFVTPGDTVTVPTVPGKSGYSNSGYLDSNGNRVSGTLEVTASATYTATYSVYTGQITQYGQLKNTEIYTPKEYNNTNNYRHWSDTIEFGQAYSVKELKSLGYTKFNLRIHAYIHSVNDGYQDFFIYSPSRELYHQRYSYGEDAYNEVYFNYSLSFADLDNNTNFQIKYAAGGWFNTLFYSTGNHWILQTYIEVLFTPAK